MDAAGAQGLTFDSLARLADHKVTAQGKAGKRGAPGASLLHASGSEAGAGLAGCAPGTGAGGGALGLAPDTKTALDVVVQVVARSGVPGVACERMTSSLSAVGEAAKLSEGDVAQALGALEGGFTLVERELQMIKGRDRGGEEGGEEGRGLVDELERFLREARAEKQVLLGMFADCSSMLKQLAAFFGETRADRAKPEALFGSLWSFSSMYDSSLHRLRHNLEHHRC